MKVWLLADEDDRGGLLYAWLQKGAHSAEHFRSLASLLERSRDALPDLFVVDGELLRRASVEEAGQMRDARAQLAPLLIVGWRDTAGASVDDLVPDADQVMLDGGSREDFLARVQTLGSRCCEETRQYEIGPFRFIPQTHTVMRNGEQIPLTTKDFELAHYLFRNIGRLLSREELLREVWAVSGVHTRTVDMHVSRVRRALDIRPEGGFRIRTIYRQGYRLEKL